MESLIAGRRDEILHGSAQPRHDLFSLMLGTSEEDPTAMTDEELVSAHYNVSEM